MLWKYSSGTNWDLNDTLQAAYYLILQDRIEEAQSLFDRIDPNSQKLTQHIQYDYFRAFLSFFYKNRAESAREIAHKYVNHPIRRVRHLFESILQRYTDTFEPENLFEGKPDRDLEIARSGGLESSFNFTVENGNKDIKITYQNLKEVTVNFYVSAY
jgi:hypothetical protein